MEHKHPSTGRGSERPRLELADIFRKFGNQYRQGHVLTREQEKAMNDIELCRTAALGGHLDVCDCCGYSAPSYNSCRNRHCPKCQSLTQAQWIQAQKKRTLPINYFHVVFTLPSELRPLARMNQMLFYNLLFRASAETLSTLAKDPKHLGAQIAFTSVLHTWTRELVYHPHIHAIVSGGGLDENGCFIKSKDDFFAPVKVISRLFRGKFSASITDSCQKGELFLGNISEQFKQLIDKLYQQEWVVYAKAPFGGPEHVFQYLGRYTHRVAISNHRLIGFDDEKVTFYTKNGETACLHPLEFIGRFLQHILPSGFTKIRHYGLTASANVNTKLEIARQQLTENIEQQADEPIVLLELGPEDETWDEMLLRLAGVDPFSCPACKKGRLIRRRLPRIFCLESKKQDAKGRDP